MNVRYDKHPPRKRRGNAVHAELYAILDGLSLRHTHLVRAQGYRRQPIRSKIAWMYNIRGVHKVQTLNVKEGILFVRTE